MSSRDRVSMDEVHQACERLMKTGSHSFFAASRILPKRYQHAATAIYAFCRVADDAVDEMPEGASLDVVMAYLHERLDAIYRHECFGIDADIAFAGTVHEYGIPKALPAALLEGFQWDSSGRRYQTIHELHDYSARVAGTVGAMMTLVMGGRSTATVARACELGVAMQLTNIARDVGEDARRGRIYLPLDWCHEEGLEVDAFLANPNHSPALGRVVARLLKVADQLYQRAETGIAALPRDCRASIMAARLIYADIGRVIRRQGFDSVSQRAVVSAPRKIFLLARAIGSYLVAPQKDYLLKPLPEIEFLVTAVPPGDSGDSGRGEPGTLYPIVTMLERIGHLERERRAEKNLRSNG
jgi:phytoene synthase